MRNIIDYFMSATPASLAELAPSVYERVFRKDFNQPGFVVVDFGVSITSEMLRDCMVMLKNRLSQLHSAHTGQKLMYHWMGRFDQQATTKFHLDNAADQSFFMLGYEPSKVKSKLYFADYVQFCNSMNLSGEEYFDKYNPMYTEGEAQLKPYTTEVEGFREDTYKIVLMNNSNMKIADGTIGVLHKAEIVQKDPDLERVINSTMIYAADMDETESFSEIQQQEFITTPIISKNY
jgi:hypothetical protein